MAQSVTVEISGKPIDIALLSNKDAKLIKARLDGIDDLEAITDELSLDAAVTLMNTTNKLHRTLDKKRTAITKPFRDATGEVNDAYKLVLAPLLEQVSDLKEGIQLYTDEATKRAAVAAQARREREAEQSKTDVSEDAPLDMAEGLDDEVPDTQLVKTRKDVEWGDIDLRKVPVEFLLVDKAALKKAILAGDTIPGVKATVYDKVIGG